MDNDEQCSRIVHFYAAVYYRWTTSDFFPKNMVDQDANNNGYIVSDHNLI